MVFRRDVSTYTRFTQFEAAEESSRRYDAYRTARAVTLRACQHRESWYKNHCIELLIVLESPNK